MLEIFDIPIMIFQGCVRVLSSIEIVSGVTMWHFFIVCAIVTGMCSVFWRSGKY